MLPDYLIKFNETLHLFQQQFPRENWSKDFIDSLVNDYAFYSSRIEDSKLEYGETIRFLHNETVRGVNFNSLLGVSEHQKVLSEILNHFNNLELTEEIILSVHASLMQSPLAWENEFKPELVGNYRNIPVVGSREPFFENKEYAPHYNLEMIMSSYVDVFNARFSKVNNSILETHLLSAVSYFHNQFLNVIHPFADGNGRVCRILIGGLLMKFNCPPIFPQIIAEEQQIEYISTIVECERQKSDIPLIEYLAKGMTDSLFLKIN